MLSEPSSSTDDHRQGNNPEWHNARSLRRFPENNKSPPPVPTTLPKPKSTPSKPETLPKPQLISNKRRSEDFFTTNSNSPVDHRRISSLLASSMKSNDQKSYDGSNSPRISRQRRFETQTGSPKSVINEEKSFNEIISSIPSENTSITRMPNTPNVKVVVEPSNEERLEKVFTNGAYLDQYSMWHEYVGKDTLSQCSDKVRQRYNNMWEFISQEFRYLKSLCKLLDVYSKDFPHLDQGSATPYVSSSSDLHSLSSTTTQSSMPPPPFPSSSSSSSNYFESLESFLPGLKPLIDCHSELVYHLIQEQSSRPDKIITDFGKVLYNTLSDDLCNKFIELYGFFSFNQVHINQKINIFKKYPNFASWLHKCERDPRVEKKSLKDWIDAISMHFTKSKTTLNNLYDNIINDNSERNYVEKCCDKLHNILKSAEEKMNRLQTQKELQNLMHNYVVTEVEGSQLVKEYLIAEQAELLKVGNMKMEFKKDKTTLRDVICVGLTRCLFFLQPCEANKGPVRYQLYVDPELPSVLEWGKFYGYFRNESSNKPESYGFYIILSSPNPAMKRMFVTLDTDREEWKNIFNTGFNQWQDGMSQIRKSEMELSENLKKIDLKWRNTLIGLELLKRLDDKLKEQLEIRTIGFQAVLEDLLKVQHSTSSSSSLEVRRTHSNVSSTSTVKADSQTDYVDSNISNNRLAPPSNHNNSIDVCTDTYIPDLSTTEGLDNCLEIFLENFLLIQKYQLNRLKFALSSSGSSITRSASEIEARKRPSIQSTVKKCETFTSRDSNQDKRNINNETYNESKKRNVSSTNKESRRISVTGLANIFRTKRPDIPSGTASPALSTRGMNHGFNDNGETNTGYSSHHADVDGMIIKDMRGINSSVDHSGGSESTGLSGAGGAFESATDLDLSNEIASSFHNVNKGAKAIVMELIKARTKTTELEAEIKRLAEENQKFTEHKNRIHGTNITEPMTPAFSTSTNGYSGFSTNQSVDTDYETFTSKKEEYQRQLEELRQKHDEFNNEKTKWKKEYDREKMKLENEKEKLFLKKKDLEDDEKSLKKKIEKHEENCKIFQEQIDLYHKHYPDFGTVRDNYPSTGSTSPSLSSTGVGGGAGDSSMMNQQNYHFRSSSDDVIQSTKKSSVSKSNSGGSSGNRNNSGGGSGMVHRNMTTPVDMQHQKEIMSPRNESPSIPPQIRDTTHSSHTYKSTSTTEQHMIRDANLLQSSRAPSNRASSAAHLSNSTSRLPQQHHPSSSSSTSIDRHRSDADSASATSFPAQVVEKMTTPKPKPNIPLFLADESRHVKDKKKKK